MEISHERAIYLVCRCCCSKTSPKVAKTITPVIHQRYKDTFQKDMDDDTPYHPKVLCPTCLRFLYNGDKVRQKMPPQYEFDMKYLRSFTQNCTTGCCEICNVANSNLNHVKTNGKLIIKNKRLPFGQKTQYR